MKINEERMLALRETLVWLRDTPELPAGKFFDMRRWRMTVYESDDRSCGTAYCLLGWHVERNPDMGLSFHGTNDICVRRTDRDDDMNFQAAATWLGTTYQMADTLLCEASYPCRTSSTDRKLFARMALERVDWLLAHPQAIDNGKANEDFTLMVNNQRNRFYDAQEAVCEPL